MVKYVEIPIEKLKIGMVIGKPIEDRLGRHLIEPGTLVNKYAINELIKSGVRNVTIQVGQEDKKGSLSTAAQYMVKNLRKSDPPTVVLESTVKNVSPKVSN
ncbi:Protein of unknown function (DUF3391) [Lachnospiraceae bacterium JC7]|nr:Protein of unknown function (DUF3391) [Lachnospiraceae bacterium JC7]